MALAIFDLDNTLIAGDSDHAWGDFLVSRGIVDGDEYKTRNDQFYQDYLNGCLDIRAYLEFALKPLSQHPKAQLLAWREQFVAEAIEPIMLAKARDLVATHQGKGDTLLIITATNRFVTEPVARKFGIDNLIATDPEETENGYSGKVSGVPSYQEGKVTRLHEWLKTNPHSLEDAYFYSDSHNDIPLLQEVGNPVAVDPDETLRQYCESAGWPVISLRTS